MRLLFFFMLLLAGMVQAQTISGYVHNSADDKPLEGISVYLDGTTFSASTNAEGYFKISTPQQFNAALVVSSVGYETQRISNPYGYDRPVKIMLKEEAIALDPVVITKSTLFSRKEMMKVFREQFLGKTAFGKSCKILNEDDIYLYYDTDTNTLTAGANKPLRIKNKKLEYDITFELVSFEVGYHWKTLDDKKMKHSFFAGTTLYKDVSEKGSADKKRREAYRGSSTHLMKTIANDSWEKDKFRLFKGNFVVKPSNYLSLKDTLGIKKVTITMPDATGDKNIKADKPFVLGVLDAERNQSFFTFSRGYFFIDRNGLLIPVNELAFGGYIGTLKAGNLLPADYVYKE